MTHNVLVDDIGISNKRKQQKIVLRLFLRSQEAGISIIHYDLHSRNTTIDGLARERRRCRQCIRLPKLLESQTKRNGRSKVSETPQLYFYFDFNLLSKLTARPLRIVCPTVPNTLHISV